MDELIFTCMDVVAEAKEIIHTITPDCTRGMTDSELQAYNLGVKNTLSIFKGIFSTVSPHECIINIDCFGTPEEFTTDELIRGLNKLMELGLL